MTILAALTVLRRRHILRAHRDSMHMSTDQMSAMPRRDLVRSWAILAFAAAYLGCQLSMIYAAHRRGDKRFGFWMFAESATFRLELIRELGDGEPVRAVRGTWAVQRPGGADTSYRWGTFVKDFPLADVDTPVRSMVGMYVTLEYLQEALNYVIARIPDDHETVRLHLVVRYSKAGGPVKEVVLSSKRRE